jgi:hypothetical protein
VARVLAQQVLQQTVCLVALVVALVGCLQIPQEPVVLAQQGKETLVAIPLT